MKKREKQRSECPKTIEEIRNPHPIVPIARLTTLFSYAGLFLFLIYGIVTRTFYPDQPELILLLALITPLLFPLRGLLQAKRYTHAWASFLFLFYYIVATDIWVRGAIPAASVIFLLTTGLFLGAALYARFSPLPFHGFDSDREGKHQQE